MIKIVSLNPVVDRIYHIPDFKAGKKYKELAEEIYVGGKGGNIARVVSQLGESCVLYSYVSGRNGHLIIEEFDTERIKLKYVKIAQDNRTSINIIDPAKGLETEITETGPTVNQSERDALVDIIDNDISKNDIVVCSGITINGVEDSIYKFISEVCIQKGAKCIIDTNKESLKQSLPGSFYFAKPNIHELKELFNIQGDLSDKEIVSLCKKMIVMGVENVFLTLGKDGALLVNKDRVISVSTPEIQRVSSIGSGDATVAGLIVGLLRDMDINSCLKLSMACGTSNATFKQVGYITKESVEQYYNEIQVKNYADYVNQ